MLRFGIQRLAIPPSRPVPERPRQDGQDQQDYEDGLRGGTVARAAGLK